MSYTPNTDITLALHQRERGAPSREPTKDGSARAIRHVNVEPFTKASRHMLRKPHNSCARCGPYLDNHNTTQAQSRCALRAKTDLFAHNVQTHRGPMRAQRAPPAFFQPDARVAIGYSNQRKDRRVDMWKVRRLLAKSNRTVLVALDGWAEASLAHMLRALNVGQASY